jgi:hypothetical protein
MEYANVSSSTIAAVGFDDTQSTLGVRFLSGREYHYFGVPRYIYEAILSASSVGQYFNEHVKKAGYQYHQIA